MTIPSEASGSTRTTYGQSVRVPKAADLVASSLRREIVRGTIGDGEALPSETELMAQFGVSRPTLREAFRVLESENLIRVRRGARGGAVAHRMTPDLVSRYAGLLLQSRGTTISDVYEAQITFEPACVRKLAESRSNESVAVLRQTLEDEQRLAEAGDDSVARVRFHNLLIRLSGNHTLELLSELITDVLVSAAAGDYPIGMDYDRAHLDHIRVVDLIEKRDADGAHDLWRRHLEGAMSRMTGQLGGDTKVIDPLG